VRSQFHQIASFLLKEDAHPDPSSEAAKRPRCRREQLYGSAKAPVDHHYPLQASPAFTSAVAPSLPVHEFSPPSLPSPFEAPLPNVLIAYSTAREYSPSKHTPSHTVHQAHQSLPLARGMTASSGLR